jgi:hypothetical protein
MPKMPKPKIFIDTAGLKAITLHKIAVFVDCGGESAVIPGWQNSPAAEESRQFFECSLV